MLKQICFYLKVTEMNSIYYWRKIRGIDREYGFYIVANI